MDTISKGDYRMLCWLRDQSQDVKLEHLDGDDRDRMERLIRQKLVSARRDTHRVPSSYGVRIGVTTTCSVSSAGRDAIVEFESNIDQQARDKAKERKNDILKWVIPIVTLILGALLDHFTGIVTLISSLFR